MPSSRFPSQERIRRRTPKVHPQHAGDPVLIPFFAALRTAMDLPALWHSTVQLLDAALPNFHYVAAMPCVEDRPIWVSTTVPGSDKPGYWENFISCEPPLSRVLATAPFSEVAYLNDHWPDEELAQSAFYQRIMQPEGWHFAAGFLFWDSGRYLGHIGMNRTRQQGPYQARERALLQEIYPQVSDAVRRIAAFDAERATRAALEEVLKLSPDGIAILDWDLNQVFGNRAAEEACLRWNEEQGGGDQLPSEVRAAAKSLLEGSESLLRQPPPGKLDAPGTELAHPLIPGLRARLRLLHPRTKQAIKPHCLVEFSRVAERSSGEPAVAAFALSAAERRVAMLVSQGRSNPAVAAELNLSIHTVRAHLREIFAKLGITRRGELAAALAGGGR